MMVHRAWVCVALVVVAAAARRPEQDFEFEEGTEGGASRRPRRYLYDPHNALCRSLICKKREVCLVRDAFTALCANKKDILRKGDSVVVTNGMWEAEPDDDVFYEDLTDILDASSDAAPGDNKPERCVGCPTRGHGEFLCGSDNRTYSSLCRLDLHNCVRRGRRPVTLACRGFCPCTTHPSPPTAVSASRPTAVSASRRPHRPRPRLRACVHFRQGHREEWRRPETAHNEVLPERASDKRQAGATECALDEMANRLLDWFSVLMEEAGATAPPADGFPSGCKPEVRWMFAHLDSDGDGVLSALNLYSLRHDERERCLRPFLSSCGSGTGSSDGGVTRAAWCGCLRRAARPCTALARAHPAPHPGAYVPACDARGYYRARQCHAALAVCWCVDPHGVEVPGSRTKGTPSCPGEAEGEGGVSVEGAPADDEDAAGSGDRDLHY